MLGVASLDVPDEAASPAMVAASDAVVLFVERARAAKSNFAVDDENAGAIGQVCRQLDGIPLAIELAAARVAMLTPGELAQRLDQRFRLLTGGQRGGVARHQTLRATIDWSYELLSEVERLLLARLSEFAGGFGLGAAEAVAGGDVVERDAVLELLGALVARSLVEANTEATEARYRLLETIRQYAEEQLDDRGDIARMRSRHAAYYTDFAERAIPDTMGPEGIEWEHRLEREFDNLHAALAWAIDTGNTDAAVRLLAAWNAPLLFTYFVPASTVYWAADAALALPGAAQHPLYPSALAVAAYGAYARGDPDLAHARCDEARDAEERLGTEPTIGLPLVRHWVAMSQANTDAMIEQTDRAVVIARSREETAWLIQALAESALAHTMAGDTDEVRASAKEILTLRRHLVDTSAVRGAVSRVAFALRDSEPSRALELAHELVTLATPDASKASPKDAGLWSLVGDIAAHNGERHEALTYLDKAISMYAWLGQRPELGSTLAVLATVLAEDAPEAAATLVGAADTLEPDVAHTRRHLDERRHITGTLETTLGTDRYTALHAHGTSMNDTDAAQLAHTTIQRVLSQDQSPTSSTVTN